MNMDLSRRLSLLRSIATGLTGVAILIGAWWLAASGTTSAQLPGPAETLATIVRTFFEIKELQYIYYSSGGLVDNLAYTVVNVLSSVAIGSCLGVVFGIFVARSPGTAAVVEPPLLVLGTFPVLALLPFLTMWFGTDRLAQYGLVLFYSFITVALVARQATLNVAGYFENFASALGANRRFFATRVILPAIVPEVIGAVRISLAAGWGFQAVAEILGAPAGAGRLIQVYSVAVMTPEIFGVVLSLGVIAVVTDAVVVAAGTWVTRWKD